MARQAANKDDRQVRLNFQLFASENALLAGDLLNHRRGKVRHTRLATLATLGLLLERGLAAGKAVPELRIEHLMTAADRADPPARSLTLEDLESVDSIGKHERRTEAPDADRDRPGS